MSEEKKKQVLVIDDEPDVATYLAMLLEDNGYETVTAANGIEGSIQGRIKHLYSIFEKLKRQGVDVANVFDFLAFKS